MNYTSFTDTERVSKTVYKYTEKNLVVRNCKTRRQIRRILISEFLKEHPGQGNRELASRYRYNVETLEDGRRVYLLRPAPLNKGFDFTIHVEDTRFKSGKTMPSHKDIMNDLRSKRERTPSSSRKLLTAIQQIYDLEEPDRVLKHIKMKFGDGYPVDLILKVIKWFFIEQDVTYWNYSGRRMFMSGVENTLK